MIASIGVQVSKMASVDSDPLWCKQLPTHDTLKLTGDRGRACSDKCEQM